MAEDALMETDGGDNITREQVKCGLVVVIFKCSGVGSDEREGSLGS